MFATACLILACCLILPDLLPCVTLLMQDSRWQRGLSSSVDIANFAPVRLQDSFFLPDAETASSPPPYPISFDNSAFCWWEDGAKSMICEYDLQDIKLVCRFHIYSDEDLPKKFCARGGYRCWTRSFSTFMEGTAKPSTTYTKIRKLKQYWKIWCHLWFPQIDQIFRNHTNFNKKMYLKVH